MRIAILAAGGVGGYLGVRLIEAGHEVTLLARGPHLAAIRERGLVLDSPAGNAHVRPALATDDPAEVGPVDVVVFAVKMPDAERAAESARPLLRPDTAVVPFQNGVESTALIARTLGERHALSGVSYISVAISEPGRIRQTGTFARFLFAERDGAQSARTDAFRAALGQAGVEAPVPDDIAVEVWKKFVLLVPHSSMTAAARCTIGEVRADEYMWAAFRRAMEETAAVGRGRGVALPEDVVETQMAVAAGMPADMRASQAHDLAAGKPLELEWLSGAVVRFGRELGIDTPVNSALHAVLRPYRLGR
jgi:2-dehydropantoate 2-reductase